MNIFKILETIETAVYSSQRLPWPCNEWSLIHRHNFLRLLDKMRQSVPEELKHARAVSKETQRLLAEAQESSNELIEKAREQAKQILDGARAEREHMLNATDIVTSARERAEELERVARGRADQLETQTRTRCQELRAQAEAYAEQTRVQAEANAEETRVHAEAYAAEVRRRAEEAASKTEHEIDAYGLRLLTQIEREVGRALDVVKSHRQALERPRDEEPGAVQPGHAHPAQPQQVAATRA
ncbi:MAG: hypothetical protein FJX76_26600 [Armatimonadetes bacterium]|nr:hypothetical protein [Armatimonadota bacterium]